MKDVQKELLSISATLSSLVGKVEKIVETIETDGGATKTLKRTKAKKSTKAPAAKKPARKKKAAAKKSAAESKDQSSSSDTMLDNIFKMISRSRNGISVERLKKRTNLGSRQVSNALYKLTKKGLVETITRGVYVKKKK